MPSEVVWKGMASEDNSGSNESQFKAVEGVSLATGTNARVHVSLSDGEATSTFTVRPWFDTIEALQAQTFATDTPSQRQQLVLDGKRLKDDGCVLALHGVVEECTIQVVMLDQKDLLDGLFDESGAVGAFAFLGDPPPETHVAMANWGGDYNDTDGCIYMP